MAQVSAPKCDICKKVIANVFCYECRHFLCQSCKSFHEKFPSTKRHTVTDSSKVDRSILILRTVCEDHELEFVYYCQDCDCLICVQCVTSVHHHHSFTGITEVAAIARVDVTNRLVKIKDSIETVSNLIKDFKRKKRHKLQAGTEKFKRSVHEVSQDLVEIMEKVTDMNLSYASDFLELENQKVLYSLTQLENLHSKYNSVLKRHEQILNEKHDVTFFLRQISLTEELELLENISTPAEPNEIECFKRDGFVVSVIERIERKYSLRYV